MAAATASHAGVVYQFDFSGISGGRPNFGVTLQFSNYVTTSGMQAVVPTAQSSLASLGYGVNYAGTNSLGWWGFDDDTNGSIDDGGGYAYGGDSFLFVPTELTGYFTTPGVFGGTVTGNALGFFSGQAVLTIRGTGQGVPEPASLALALLALGFGVAASRRRPA